MESEELNLDALTRLWPLRRYGERGDWFQYVGRTKAMRNALVARRLIRGKRGAVTALGHPEMTRNSCSGEFVAREI